MYAKTNYHLRCSNLSNLHRIISNVRSARTKTLDHSFQVFPFVFVLMSKKSRVAYEHVFRFVEHNVFSLKCKSFTTDYEMAMRIALQTVYPNTRLVACWFHFTQAVKRRAGKFDGFVKFLSSSDGANTIYHKLQCLPLLPAHEIKSAYVSLKEQANALDKVKFRDFLKYYEGQWIKKARRCYTQLSNYHLFIHLSI